jgi:1-pyrroline-5-carboxylate dehydrogenase
MAEEAVTGDVADFRTFMGAVIDRASFESIRGYIGEARAGGSTRVAVGGQADDETGFFIRPTVLETSDPKSKTMEEEIFGPVLTVYVYEDARFDDVLDLVDATSPYALTGSVFARSRALIRRATDRLVQAAGNLSINDKPTGAVVGRQPFGGARLSGTNDKAGSWLNLIRWTSPRTIKETFSPPEDFAYPAMRG